MSFHIGKLIQTLEARETTADTLYTFIVLQMQVVVSDRTGREVLVNSGGEINADGVFLSGTRSDRYLP
jgi:hypothetical protein